MATTSNFLITKKYQVEVDWEEVGFDAFQIFKVFKINGSLHYEREEVCSCKHFADAEMIADSLNKTNG